MDFIGLLGILNNQKKINNNRNAGDMSEINKKIGLKIKRLRKSYGLSQIQLAEKINLSFQQIQKYEKGITAISVFRLQQIADAFGVSTVTFFDKDLQRLDVEESAPSYAPDKAHLKTSQVFTREEISLLKSFRKIRNKKIRQGVILQLKGLVELEKAK